MRNVDFLYAIKATGGVHRAMFYSGNPAVPWQGLRGALFYQSPGRAKGMLDRLRQRATMKTAGLRVVPVVCVEVADDGKS